jgi:hypothetical protein
VRIDGGTSVDERQTIVDNFNCRGVGQVRAAAGTSYLARTGPDSSAMTAAHVRGTVGEATSVWHLA